jgi:DNA-binding transcriptional ArsR family regulator
MPDDATQSLRAIAHPLRLQILSLLTGTELSAAEVARELDVTHANASYHLRVLLDADLVRRVRHAVPNRYGHYTDAELWVTQDDFDAVRASVTAASTRLHESARPPRSEGTRRVALTIAMFEMHPGSAEEPS